MLKTQELLFDKGLSGLDELSIKIREYENFYVFNYDQLNSPKHNDVVKECRGLILSRDFKTVLCRSFDRFFNYEEDPESKNINIGKCIAYEKVDGSLVRFWYNPFENKWVSATRSMAYAEGPVTLGDRTFYDVICHALNNNVNEFCLENNFDKNLTYIFELVSPYTRVVKLYEGTFLYMLSVRNNNTGEYNNDECKRVKNISIILSPKIYKFSTWSEIKESMNNLPTVFDEGYVVVSKDEYRIKIKNPSHVAISKMRENGCISLKHVIDLIWSNDHEEYLSVFNEDKELFEPYIKSFQNMKDHVIKVWNETKNIENKKDFAMKVKDLRISSFLFALKENKTNINEFISFAYNKSTNLLNNFAYDILEHYKE